MKEVNKLRIERLARRFDARRARPPEPIDPVAHFEAEFVRIREEIILPLLTELGGELRKAGHDYAVEKDTDRPAPSVVLRVLLKGAKPGNKNAIGFFVQHDGVVDGKSEVIPYLELKNVFDLGRFHILAEMKNDTLEQMLVDGLEHMMACNEG